jgi:pilus assembly protein Flp/PilA
MTMFHYWKTLLATHLPQKSEKGQDLGEYALLFALIAIAVVVAVGLLGTNLSDFFNAIAGAVAGWTGLVP